MNTWKNSIEQRNKSTEEKFWEKVSRKAPDECWEWLAAKNKKGYGNFYLSLGHSKSLHQLAHRYSWKLFFGEVPEGMLVCHKCDNPSCVNPDHLFLGTSKDNATDMSSKGRSASQIGYKNSSPFCWEDIHKIRELWSDGYTGVQLAEMFGVSSASISKIVRNETWVK